MVVKGIRRQLILNSTLKKDNNFTEKEKKKKGKPEMKIGIPGEDKDYLNFRGVIVPEDVSFLLTKENNFMVPLLFNSWSLSLTGATG